jgi:hypothetical protein
MTYRYRLAAAVVALLLSALTVQVASAESDEVPVLEPETTPADVPSSPQALPFSLYLPLVRTNVHSLPTGSLTVVTGPYACTGQECYDVRIQCTQLTAAIGATLRVGEPTSQPEHGTLIFFTGWTGTSFLDEWGLEAQRILADLRATGYRTVQTKWASDWLEAAANEPAGFARLACRPATVTRWIVEKWRQPHAELPFCVYGHSDGATGVAFLLARYGLADVLSAAMMDGGPAASRLDSGCLHDDPQRWALWYDATARDDVDLSLGYPTSGTGPCSKQDSTWRSQFEESSVALGQWQYVYPRTMVHFVFGELDTMVARAHGDCFYQKLVGVRTPLLRLDVVAGANHETIGTPQGADTIRDGLIADCHLR